ncbi:mediator of RNA polymerase II transcription subunit 6 [Cryptomeria japonica]|uniref:mediator of RNA polymerase II transcription subunit 6 n=1 Tax=Cryptomeria japonica TaxID=3369 RepID=UPI0025AC4711|nr:mediator of RNA polymerase II transcription subunit 6 [Cryptomeria japonica]XP_059063859.1 mediator of RNA polymerase II transcription subunit 6 [Cryptomeria japonica]XP_059063860.1 mediator of RNA polymerase II transcription subunit 6 [Cryptomeria japonica]XP_059063861.1 mediator of RNA polymerase II transcription subunit 6 [Cryptomeria japonica]XP_059063862.1 mediator of RNA polymerase II transcription subunit 6 [Cryptomeria japonica]XP_059063863.1 mediator of RNA polymerase II transcript
MAATPVPPPGGMMMGMEGMQPPPPPGTDMTGICFRDQIWLNAVPLDRNFVFDYFALSPFYDWTCNNEQLRRRSIHPLDMSHLSKMTGIEFVLNEVLEPHLFVFRKQKRDGPEKITPMLTYYVLDGSIYQAPQLCSIFASRMVRALYHISKSFRIASSKLEKIGYDTEGDNVKPDAKSGVESVDFKEIKRVDHILATLQRKLPPAPPPPPFPEGFAAPSDTAQGQDGQAQDEHIDPIFDQGPPGKRPKIEK